MLSNKILKFRKFVSFLLTFSLLVNSLFAPTLVIAQDATAEPTPAAEEVQETQAPEAPQESTETSPIVETTLEPEATDPVSTEQVPEVIETIDPTPTVTATATPLLDEEISEDAEVEVISTVTEEEIIESPLPELDLDEQVENSSATLTSSVSTDKSDYAPDEKVLITANGLNPEAVYLLKISSSDPPPVTHETNVTADSTGTATYLYQLDGNYRPDYLVEVFLGDSLVTSTTFTDSHVISHECQTDSAGADDEPGQKDLTQMCVDYSNLDTSFDTDWNWDDTSWPGANTGDACSLFDTDGDGLANYALCVTVSGSPATLQAYNLYSCNDTSASRCFGSVGITPSAGTTCTAGVQAGVDPFDSGSDTVANCTVATADIANGELIDVCSYPSQSPNSDPSDCIVFRPRTGKLEVVKLLNPSTDTGLFNLQIDEVTVVANVGHEGTTGEQVLGAGTYSVGETAGTGTSLENYTTSIVCKDLNGIGETIASSNDSGPLDVVLAVDDDIVCTITNNVAVGSITVDKVTDPSADPQSFDFIVSGTGYNNFSLTDEAAPNTQELLAGTYSVTETVPAGWDLTSATCDDGSPINAIDLAAGEDVTCTFTNTKLASVTVIKNVVPNDGSIWDFVLAGPGQFANGILDLGHGESQTKLNLEHGDYTLTESIQGGYVTESSCDTNDTGLDSVDFVLEAGADVTCTFTNTRITGDLTLIKSDQNGVNPTDWTFDVDGPDSDFEDVPSGTTLDDLPLGTYLVSENGPDGYTFAGGSGEGCTFGRNGLTVEITVDGTSLTCTFINRPTTGSIEGTKFEDLDGNTQTDDDQSGILGWTINLFLCGQNWVNCVFEDTTQTAADGSYSFSNLLAGYYQVVEVMQDGWLNLTSLFQNVQVVAGDDTTDVDFVNQRVGELIVNKAVDADANNQYEGGNTEANEIGFAWGLDGENPERAMGTTVSGLALGTHSVNENDIDGFNFTGWYYTNGDGSCQNTDGQTLPVEVEIAFNETAEITLCNQKDLVNLTVNKGVDIDLDGRFDMNNSGANALGFRWGLDAEVPARTMGSSVDIAPGEYEVSENDIANYEFYGWYYGGLATQNRTCANPEGTEFPVLDIQEDTEITLCNRISTGTIEVHKLIDNDGDLDFDDATPELLAQFAWGLDGEEPTNAMGTSEDTVAGSHEVSENDVAGFEFARWYIGEPNSRLCRSAENLQLPAEVEVVAGETLVITLCNKLDLPKIGVNKVLDLDGDGEIDERSDYANTLGLRWGLDGEVETNLMGTSEDVLPGSYLVTENQIEGYEYIGYYFGRPDRRTCDELDGTDFPQVEVAPGEEVGIVFCNVKILDNETLLIEKSNDNPNADPGDIVNYTIVVTNQSGKLVNNLEIIDILPGGFSYVAGSTLINGIAGSDPTNESGKLTWSIPFLLSDSSVEVQYQTQISSDADRAVYTNFATCKGTVNGINENELDLVSLLINIQEEEVECGSAQSDVGVSGAISLSTGVGGGDVLGASIGQVLGAMLPAAGSETTLLIVFLVMIATGVILKRVSRKVAKNV